MTATTPKAVQKRETIPNFRSLPLFVSIVLKEFFADRLLIRAMALTFGTLLSLLPLLALILAIFRLLGGGEWFLEVVRPVLWTFLAPGVEPIVTEKIITLLETFATKTVGSVGLILSLFGLHAIFASVEATFNFIWGGAPRGKFLLRAPRYWALFLFIPILLAGSIVFTTAIAASPLAVEMASRVSFFEGLLQRSIPALMMVICLTLVYKYLPNAPVTWRAALVGGLSTGILYDIVKHFFIFYAARLMRYDVLYGSIAIIPMTMVWINISWMLTLLGGEVAYIFQHFNIMRREQKHLPLSRIQQDALAYRLMLAAREAADSDGKGWVSITQLGDDWNLPAGAVIEPVERMVTAGLLEKDDHGGDTVKLRHAAKSISISKIQTAINAELTLHWHWPTDQAWTRLRDWLKQPTGRREVEGMTLEDLSGLLEKESQKEVAPQSRKSKKSG